ncbi:MULTISPECIES: Fur family transcriptional regulator [Myroides]|uniref:Transcriptional repressor n=1 Tax=Myroides albus TaxID=2562892 RepID=A0A6I3LQU2_9FLAO|nr:MULTISPECIES: transcriptional repressor [Myroides]MTG99051.1 transcriptional repressor [Myroides albus]MVX36649.1 transcriptional repressor [Myroides sp. LoEW2-1]UVD80408.1 transcriptional repressor [Myroides albus]
MSMDKLEKQLTDKKINPTAMRLLILKFLKQQNGAVSLADIESSFEQSDRVTIYRTVKTFESKGLLHSITTNNVTQYALCSQECDANSHHDTHLHFVCSSCKKTICLTQVSIPQIEIPQGFQLDDIEIVAKGICRECKS